MQQEITTPQAMTRILRNAGALPHGEVRTVDIRHNPAFNSTTTHLLLTYSTAAPSTAPTRLLLKRNIPESWAVEAGIREVTFYQTSEQLPDRLPMLVRCYDASRPTTTSTSYVLLHDLSATHHAPLTRDQQLQIGENMPAAIDIDRVVDALARFHAYWWDHALLGTPVAPISPWWQDWSHYAHEIRRREAAWAALVESEHVWFPTDIQRLYEDALTGLPKLWEHYHAPRLTPRHNLTLTHNDAYFTNFLCPNEGVIGETYLIDWQGAATGRGADDLANLLATGWTLAQRKEAQRENRILRRYHDVLRTHGVQNYSWEELQTDYRIAVTEWLFQPVQDRSDGASKDYWWPKLQCLAGAFQDLDCPHLFKS